MNTTEYRRPDGSTAEFTAPQRIALERAGRLIGYTLMTTGRGRPTYTDKQVADMCAGYKQMTSVRLKAKRYRGTHSYIVVDPSDDKDISVASFDSVLDAVAELKCNVITMAAQDVRSMYYRLAEDHGITLLAI